MPDFMSTFGLTTGKLWVLIIICCYIITGATLLKDQSCDTATCTNKISDIESIIVQDYGQKLIEKEISFNKYKFSLKMFTNNQGKLDITMQETTSKDKFNCEYTEEELKPMQWFQDDIEKIKLFINKSLFDPTSEMSHNIGFINKNSKNENKITLNNQYVKEDDCLVIVLEYKNDWIQKKWQLFLDFVDEDDVSKLKAIIVDLRKELKETKHQLQHQMNKDGVPARTIAIWSGSIENIPNGWILCDGTNNTPDLTGKFILGTDNNEYKIGDIGGSAEHKHGITVDNTALTIDQMPKHSHKTCPYKYHAHSAYSGTGFYIGNKIFDQHCMESDSIGSGQEHDHSANCGNISHMPPYIVLGFIMKKE